MRSMSLPARLMLVPEGLSHHEIRSSSDAIPQLIPQARWDAITQAR